MNILSNKPKKKKKKKTTQKHEILQFFFTNFYILKSSLLILLALLLLLSEMEYNTLRATGIRVQYHQLNKKLKSTIIKIIYKII